MVRLFIFIAALSFGSGAWAQSLRYYWATPTEVHLWWDDEEAKTYLVVDAQGSQWEAKAGPAVPEPDSARIARAWEQAREHLTWLYRQRPVPNEFQEWLGALTDWQAALYLLGHGELEAPTARLHSPDIFIYYAELASDSIRVQFSNPRREWKEDVVFQRRDTLWEKSQKVDLNEMTEVTPHTAVVPMFEVLGPEEVEAFEAGDWEGLWDRWVEELVGREGHWALYLDLADQDLTRVPSNGELWVWTERLSEGELSTQRIAEVPRRPQAVPEDPVRLSGVQGSQEGTQGWLRWPFVLGSLVALLVTLGLVAFIWRRGRRSGLDFRGEDGDGTAYLEDLEPEPLGRGPARGGDASQGYRQAEEQRSTGGDMGLAHEYDSLKDSYSLDSLHEDRDEVRGQIDDVKGEEVFSVERLNELISELQGQISRLGDDVSKHLRELEYRIGKSVEDAKINAVSRATDRVLEDMRAAIHEAISNEHGRARDAARDYMKLEKERDEFRDKASEWKAEVERAKEQKKELVERKEGLRRRVEQLEAEAKAEAKKQKDSADWEATLLEYSRLLRNALRGASGGHEEAMRLLGLLGFYAIDGTRRALVEPKKQELIVWMLWDFLKVAQALVKLDEPSGRPLLNAVRQLNLRVDESDLNQRGVSAARTNHEALWIGGVLGSLQDRGVSPAAFVLDTDEGGRPLYLTL